MQYTEYRKVRFDIFELDEADARLANFQNGDLVQLPPKAFAVLCALVRQPGKLVGKDALLDEVWGHRHVSESVLKSTISQLRIALGDDPKQPRLIETLARRGYRFVAEVHSATDNRPQLVTPPTVAMIGRQDALAKLHAAWTHALQGRRQILWLTGEAGVGKTTLIEAFVAAPTVSADPKIFCIRGQCVEEYGGGEPYMPVLEALAELSRRDDSLISMLRNFALTWLMQMPWLCSAADRSALQLGVAGANQDRMLREFGELIEHYTQQCPVLLITEDLHWSDPATLRLIDHVARRRAPARLMWLASFRLTEVIATDHPLKGLRHELRLHRLCHEIALDSFSERELLEYIRQRFPAMKIPESFVRALYEHTDGLPLFIVNLVDDWLDQGVLDLHQPAPLYMESNWNVPENLAGVMEKQIARLPAEIVVILEAAGVCGVEFRAEILALALERDVFAVADQLDELVRQQYWVGHLDMACLPDGTLDTRYVFRHALYRQVFYRRLAGSARVKLHRKIAAALELNLGKGFPVAPAELAAHFAAGQLPLPAAKHYADAAERALNHFAPEQALSLVERGLALLATQPETSARLSIELNLVLRQAIASTHLYGMTSQEMRAAYLRAEKLCTQLTDTTALGWVIAGLSQAHFAEGDFIAMLALGKRVQDLAERQVDKPLAVTAGTILAVAQASLGEHLAAQRLLLEALNILESLGDRLPAARFFIDPHTLMRGHLAMFLVPTGQVDEARQQAMLALVRGSATGHHMAKGLALRCAGLVEAQLENPAHVAELAEELVAIGVAYGFPDANANGNALAGWAQARLGDPQAGLQRIRAGQMVLQKVERAAGSLQLACFAIEALTLQEEWAQAQAELEAAVALAQSINERFHLPDLLLLKAQILSGLGKPEAGDILQLALDEARAQGALWQEIRVLAQLCESHPGNRTWLDALAQARRQLVQGRDTHLVVRVDALLKA